jgi:hypothetical protein
MKWRRVETGRYETAEGWGVERTVRPVWLVTDPRGRVVRVADTLRDGKALAGVARADDLVAGRRSRAAEAI